MIDAFSDIELKLRNAIMQDRLAHAYLFLGPEAVGKFRFALKFARLLLCESKDFKPCGECNQCRLVISQSHPDLHILEVKEDEKQIKIDEVRDWQRQLSYKPFQAKFKIGIIKEAERLTLQAMNSLLKILEEPLADTVLILTSSNRSRLLPTVVSRCQILRFRPVRKEILVDILSKEQKLSLEKANIIANYAEGSLEKIDELVGLMEQRRKFFENWLSVRSTNQIDLFELTQEKGFSKNIKQNIDFFINWYRDILRVKLNLAPEFNSDFELLLKGEAEKLSIDRIISGLDLLLRLEEEMVIFNLNAQTVGEQIFWGLR